MLAELKAFIKKEDLFLSDNRILLAVSGGIDSALMCDLFHAAQVPFGIAHCNFGLRKKESDDDELFVEALAEKYNVPFHCITFSTKLYAKNNKLSIQEAARDLRYEWFEKIRKQHRYAFIATAHHRDDSIETFLINLIRGTGISGMHGILPKQGKVIRPLLFASKEQIRKHAKKIKLKFREDSSNASDKYLRNKIRNKIIPSLKELNPKIENALFTSIEHLRDAEIIYRAAIEKKRKQLFKINDEEILISIKKFLKLHPLKAYAYEFFSPFGFNAASVDEIILSLDGISGKQFFSGSHRLVKDREFLILQKKIPQTEQSYLIEKGQSIINTDVLKLSLKTLPAGTNFSQASHTASLDHEKLKFPLMIRGWRKGDVFQPLGMKGKKKLSDFFTDNKFSLADKERTRLMISGEDIVWVVGHRIDERFKVTNKTKKIYFAELSE